MELPVDAPAPITPTQAEITHCVGAAAARYATPELLIRSILKQESANGSWPGGRLGETKDEGRQVYAIGPMQVTSIWLPELAEYGITEDHLKWDLCTNIGVGVWILKGYYEDHEQDWTSAIMAYNAGYKLENGRGYARSVIATWHDYYAKAVPQ